MQPAFYLPQPARVDLSLCLQGMRVASIQGRDLLWALASAILHIMIPHFIDSFYACPPISVSLSESQTTLDEGSSLET